MFACWIQDVIIVGLIFKCVRVCVRVCVFVCVYVCVCDVYFTACVLMQLCRSSAPLLANAPRGAIVVPACDLILDMRAL